MKKIKIFAVLTVCVIILSVTVCAFSSKHSKDLRVLENVEALASGEGGECTGPKVMHWFHIYCECTNQEPCSDNYNCKSL